MKKWLLLCGWLMATGLVNAATVDTTKTWRLTTHGFVNPVLYADSRQVVSGREGMMLFYPAAPRYDVDGADLNAVPSLNMLSITARANLSIEGPAVLGARVRGFIEGDFTGATDATINMFRLRHAYIHMAWQHSNLLVGQYWYPMVIHEIMPLTQPLNMGAPFHPYARYNQIRYTYRRGAWEAIGVAAFQLDNKSQGALGSSTTYLRTACVPEMNIQLRYVGSRLLLGVAANALVTRPRTYVSNADTADLLRQTTQRYASVSYSLFGNFQWKSWQLKAQILLSDNIYEGCSLGGFIEDVTIDSTRYYAYNYRPWTYTTCWVDLGRTIGHWRPGVFMGYGVNNNFGQVTPLTSNVYGRGYDIQYLYRVQPRMEYYAGYGLTLSLEVEHTCAQYGEQVLDGMDRYHYRATADQKVRNTRGIIGLTYRW